MDKVSFQEAAKQAGIHLNTVKNWRKAGKFKTAQKVLENGHELWLVDPAEVVLIARQARQDMPDIAQQTNVQLGEDKVDNRSDAHPESPEQPGLPPALEQNLTFFRESIVRPLVEDLARARTELGQAKEEIGTLKERLRALEAAQALRDAARLAESAPPADITPRPENGPQTAQEPSPILHTDTLQPITTPTKKGFWAKVFGG